VILVFRRMEMKDVSQVYKIERQLFPNPWPKKCFINDIEDIEISYPYVVEKNKKVIGYIVCWYYAYELHIGNIAVLDDHQGTGVGRYLLNKIFELITDYKTSYLEVRESNIRAINLYKKFGFEPFYLRYKYYSNGENAIVMVKSRDRKK
jgi:ribosomal-protein-alanine N-acetyltransferase